MPELPEVETVRRGLAPVLEGVRLSRGLALDVLFLSAVAFAVAAIPTALPAVTTAILSKGSQQLADAGAEVEIHTIRGIGYLIAPARTP